MTPGRYDPPVIYRGCDWPAITLIWKDISGNPIDLTGFVPFVQMSNGIPFHALITDAVNGVTTLSMDQNTTNTLKLGRFWYDWIWWQNPTAGIKSSPSLFGEVEIKEPKTHNFIFPG